MPSQKTRTVDIPSKILLSPDTRERAQKFLTHIQSHKTRPTSNDIFACVWLAIKESRSSENPTLRELTHFFKAHGHSVSNKRVNRTLFALKDVSEKQEEIDRVEVYIRKIVTTFMTNQRILKRIERFGLDTESYREELEEIGISTLGAIPSNIRAGKNPYVLATAVVYQANRKIFCDTGGYSVLSIEIVQDVAGVTQQALCERISEIKKHLPVHRSERF